MVKLTVNFDDPTTYHLYSGYEIGHPGTILTFFPWPDAPKGYRGTGSIVSRTETENLYRLFQKANSNVTLKWQYSSHNLIQDDLIITKDWISNNFH